MELPDVGKYCSLGECNKLDYLAVECTYCRSFFCDEHWRSQDHDCKRKDLVKDRIVPACPICGDVIATNPDEEPDIVINRHIESGMCSPKAKHNNGNGSSNRKGPASGPKGGGGGGGCAAKGCTTKTHAWTICSSCKKRYCLKHRFPDVHDCQTMRASSLPTFSSRIDALIGKNSSNSNSNNSSPAPNGRPASTSPASRAGAGRGKRSGQTKFKDSGCVIA